jgi:hypothetical protein
MDLTYVKTLADELGMNNGNQSASPLTGVIQLCNRLHASRQEHQQ